MATAEPHEEFIEVGEEMNLTSILSTMNMVKKI